MIEIVTESTIADAARIHSISWRESHKSFCSREFIELHDEKHQQEYIRGEMARGCVFFMLKREKYLGIMSVNGSLIENLYVLPEYQNMGTGTELLRFAMDMCDGTPTLWILDNNTGARRLYERHGFALSGRKNAITSTLYELEMVFTG